MIQKLTNKLTNRKKDNKGFTLVELIVVIVILAILAALLIPALLGWIDKAKEEQYVLEARNVYLAVQAQVAEEYAAGTGVSDVQGKINGKLSEIAKLADVKKVTTATVTFDNTAGLSGKDQYRITTLVINFDSATGKTIGATLNANEEWTINSVTQTSTPDPTP